MRDKNTVLSCYQTFEQKATLRHTTRDTIQMEEAQKRYMSIHVSGTYVFN